jgi:LysR family transcriptional regulator, hca operon transcriptional activator
MEFRRGHLPYFVAVAEEGQITRAAKRLHIAQPALSQAIAQLEADIGFRLLERHARGVRLTPAGERFLVNARAAVAAWSDASAAARSAGRVLEGVIEFGFLGAPPALDSPAPLQRFAALHPGLDLRYRDLPFPTLPTASWLADVDIAVCHRPPPDAAVWELLVRSEPRVVLAPAHHPLAAQAETGVEEVLGETFIGLHADVAPEWAGFWSLDDHRGARPARVTPDSAANPQEVLAALALRHAITTVPASVASLLAGPHSGIAAVSLRDAAPALITLVGHAAPRNPRVEALLEFARSQRE